MNENHIDDACSGKISRPKRVIFLGWVVMILAIWNVLRLGWAAFFWHTLDEYAAGAGPLCIFITGTLWFLGWGFLAWGIWTTRTWAWKLALASVFLYPVWFWLDRLILQRGHASWIFSLIFTIIWFGIFLLILLTHKTRAFFRTRRGPNGC